MQRLMLEHPSLMRALTGARPARQGGDADHGLDPADERAGHADGDLPGAAPGAGGRVPRAPRVLAGQPRAAGARRRRPRHVRARPARVRSGVARVGGEVNAARGGPGPPPDKTARLLPVAQLLPPARPDRAAGLRSECFVQWCMRHASCGQAGRLACAVAAVCGPPGSDRLAGLRLIADSCRRRTWRRTSSHDPLLSWCRRCRSACPEPLPYPTLKRCRARAAARAGSACWRA